VDPAPRASAICKDPDDQQFIDLAVQHGALLLSKDRAVLNLRKRLLALGVQASTAL
jgi:predicted nucleic acid-binding protein